MSGLARHRGQETQHGILEQAVHPASVRGLDAMSLSTLADAADLSKSGLFAHSRSKEALQLAIIEEAERIFRAAVLDVAERDRPGLLRRPVLAYIRCMATNPFRGGRFFAAALHEFDGRPGAVRERLRGFLTAWMDELRAAFDAARTEGVVDADAERCALLVTSLGLGVNCQVRMGALADDVAAAALSLVDEAMTRRP